MPVQSRPIQSRLVSEGAAPFGSLAEGHGAIDAWSYGANLTVCVWGADLHWKYIELSRQEAIEFATKVLDSIERIYPDAS
jgi:hypothetical protein